MRPFVNWGVFFAAAGLLSATFAASAGSWPCWRGPNHDGICTETGLLQTWTEKGPPLKWHTKGLGFGYSSVSVENGYLYTMGRFGGSADSSSSSRFGRLFRRSSQPQNTGDCKIVALDARDGRLIWSTTIGAGDPSCTPAADGERVYGLDRNGQLSCLRAVDGGLIWSKSLTKEFGGQTPSMGFSESPLVDEGKILCTPGAHNAMIVALDKETGAPLWKGETPAKLGYKGSDSAGGCSSIVISHAGGVKQYVQLVGRGLVAFRADDGKFLWHYNGIANRTANWSTPIVKDEFVFASSGYPDGGTVLLELKKIGDTFAAKPVYFLPADRVQNQRGEMVLINNHVYFGNGQNNGSPICIELATGRIAWKGSRGAGRGSAAVIQADGELYFRYQNGVMGLVEANPEKYVLKGNFELATHNGKSCSPPVIVDHCLYVRDRDAVLCYDVAQH